MVSKKTDSEFQQCRDQVLSEVTPLPVVSTIREHLQILCDDAPVLAVNKPAGMLSQGGPTGVFSLPDYVKAWLKEKYQKPGNVYLGVIHRLDRPVTGVVVFSRNSKGAARLAEQFRERTVRKTYLALLEHQPDQTEAELVDYIRKIPDQARAEISEVETTDAKLCRLKYRVLGTSSGLTLVEVEPLTGRMHQIRLQFASRGCPILGDQLYGAKYQLNRQPIQENYTEQIALHAWKLKLKHPVRYDDLEISAPLPNSWPDFARNLLT